MVSVLVLTKNDEASLAACLRSVAWSDDIVVFDAFSTDRTVEIAQQFGARVYKRAFDTELEQRQAALQVDFKHPWVYNPAPDEITPPRLRDEILAVADANPPRPESAFRVRYRFMFLGRWIRFSSLYPTWVVRLFKPDKVTVQNDTDLRYVTSGPEGKLLQHVERYRFTKGISDWWLKHNDASSVEASEAVKLLRTGRIDWVGLLAANPARRRAAMRSIGFRIPFRSLCVYLYLMFLRGGILDGPAGWTYCRMRAYHQFLIAAKLHELKRLESGEPPG